MINSLTDHNAYLTLLVTTSSTVGLIGYYLLLDGIFFVYNSTFFFRGPLALIE